MILQHIKIGKIKHITVNTYNSIADEQDQVFFKNG
ncbi:hypothetical protein ALQ74_200141 [Pseudomonas savastanoi pv. glycinea]|uniref:Uncharacterized protein n=1 Tax=Pseudomonas savastanoi pv. glycinea TaxID=318 RepID=A0A3M3FGY0_PSESG|nr:hypothetical protein ALQ74_200141 [Pseudomonas savastanoi pv. glycinea]